MVLVPDGLAEQTGCGLRRCSPAVSADALALHSHGSALLSVHPKFPAAADRHVIAACASSVEQAAGGMGFADVGKEKATAHAGIRSRRRVALDRTERLDIVGGNHRVGATSSFEARGSPRRFRRIYSSCTADTAAIRGINFALH